MPNTWQEVYTELTDFIAGHSEINIEANRVRLPVSVRPEFYRLFRAVRIAFLEGKYSNVLNEAKTLSQNYLVVEQEVTKRFSLDNVSMLPKLGRLLRDPLNQLIEGLFDPLFDLLKGRIGIEIFKAIASQKIETSFESLHRLGYEKWMVLSLVKLLEADDLFQVIPPNRTIYDAHKLGGLFEEEVPNAEESRSILFKHAPDPVFIVPDLTVHSTKVNRYIAIRSQIGKAFGIATDASKEREWLTLDYVVALEPGLTLIYVADNTEEISLIADVNKICRPDLIMICREQKDWHEKEGLEKIKLSHATLKPTLGTYIVSREPVPQQENEGLEGINMITVGFDQSKLEPIITALMQTESEE